MIRQVPPLTTLAACTGCHKPPMVEHDRRHGGTYYVACHRCGVRTVHFTTQQQAESNWGAAPNARLRLRAAQ